MKYEITPPIPGWGNKLGKKLDFFRPQTLMRHEVGGEACTELLFHPSYLTLHTYEVNKLLTIDY